MDTGYSFHISDSYSPDTIPMERLAEYMGALARLLGEAANVHFKKVFEGSVALRAAVDEPARPKVRDRVQAVRSGTAPRDVRKAFDDLDEMLRSDNAYGSLNGDQTGEVIPFPGKRRAEPVVFGPFRQDGSLEGQVYRIGGKDESKHVHIRTAKEDLSVLTATEEIALRLRHHLFGGTLRFRGAGTWYRHGDGRWELKAFRILDFEELDDAPLDKVVARLRAAGGGSFTGIDAPAPRLLDDRADDGDAG
jgi:hypothetical protein